MGDNSLDWASLLGALSDSDELISLLLNDVKAENPENDKLQESSKVLLQPAMLPYQNINVIRDVEHGSSSCLTQNLQNGMITTGGCLMNPLGFPCRSRKHVAPAAATSGTGIRSSQQLLILNDIPAKKRMRKKIQEAAEEAEQRKKMNKIKNRISVVKSRAKRQEHTKFLEERVEQLRNENAHLKKLLSLEGEEIALKRQTNGQKLDGCINVMIMVRPMNNTGWQPLDYLSTLKLNGSF